MAFFFPFSTILIFSVIAFQLQKVSYHVPKGELLDDDSSPFALQLLLSGKNKLKPLCLFIHRYCSRFTHLSAWFSVSNCKHYKMRLFW